MIFAPSAAASRTRFVTASIFASISSEKASWSAAMVTSVMAKPLQFRHLLGDAVKSPAAGQDMVCAQPHRLAPRKQPAHRRHSRIVIGTAIKRPHRARGADVRIHIGCGKDTAISDPPHDRK